MTFRIRKVFKLHQNFKSNSKAGIVFNDCSNKKSSEVKTNEETFLRYPWNDKEDKTHQHTGQNKKLNCNPTDWYYLQTYFNVPA